MNNYVPKYNVPIVDMTLWILRRKTNFVITITLGFLLFYLKVFFVTKGHVLWYKMPIAWFLVFVIEFY